MEAVRVCEALLEEKDLDPAVRVGDAYGFLVEHYCHHGNFQLVCCVFRGLSHWTHCSGPNQSAVIPGVPTTLVSDSLDSIKPNAFAIIFRHYKHAKRA